MGAPDAPTTTTIVTEALKRYYNGQTPSSAELTRGEDYGLEKVKRDIMNIGKTWRPLIKTYYDITKVGVNQYANPTDFERHFSVGLMTGDHSGALTVVTDESHMTLAADEDMTQIEAEGKTLLVTSGTGVDQAEVIDDYNATTKAVTLAAPLATEPIATDEYLIVNSITNLREMSLMMFDLYQHQGIAGEPTRVTIIPNDAKGKIGLYPCPNAVAGLQIRYYADLMLLDVESTLYSSLLRRWAGLLEQGVYVWKLGEDDDRYQSENQIYQNMLLATMALDLDGFDAARVMGATSGGQ